MRLFPNSGSRVRACALLTLAWSCACARAEEPPERPFKLTSGIYLSSGADQPSDRALDINLRHTSSWGNAWLGWYRSPATQLSQTRAGWDHSFDLGALRVQPSLQIASGGFRGGSLYFETGEDWFAGAGIGRTNLRPYVNLNFDPNDSWTLAAGRRWGENHSLSLLLVRDNRENPDQRHLHLVYRTPRPGGERLTVDLLAKRGLVEGSPVSELGLTVGYDWRRFFVRAAWDPKVNFSAQNMLRLSAGTRF